jgi:hypothetical protein
MDDYGPFPPPGKTFPPPHNAHKDCRICNQHFLTEESQRADATRQYQAYNDLDGQLQLRAWLNVAKADLSHVKAVLLSHGDLVMSRWKKLGQGKRRELLSKASPALFGPGATGPATTKTELCEEKVNFHEAIPGMEANGFALDWMKLMSLLHVRCEYGPEQWAAFDTRSSHAGCCQSRWAMYMFNPSGVIMQGERYGNLVEFDVNAAHGWQQAGFPRAAVTLMVQGMIANALKEAVDSIVAGAEPTGNAEWTALVSRGLHSANDDALWSSYYYQEFAPPATLNPDVLLQKIRNHLDMLVDETELMQTSPEYMRQFALGCKAQTFTFGNDKAEQQWVTVARMINLGSSSDLICWVGVIAEVENLKRKLSESKSSTDPGTSLTKEADGAMRCFGRMISLLLLVVVQGEARQAVLSVKEIFDYVLRWNIQDRARSNGCEPDDASLDNLEIGQKARRALSYVEGMTDVVRGKDPDPDEIHLLTLVRSLKHELRDVSYNKSVENFISSIALMDEVRTLWYWRQVADHKDPLTEDVLRRDISSRGVVVCDKPPVHQKDSDCTPQEKKVDSQLGQLLSDFCALPVPKGPKNLSWLENKTATRERLTNFWQCVRENWSIGRLAPLSSNALKADMLSRMSFDVSPKYLARLEEERRDIEDKDQHEKKLKAQRQSDARFVKQPWDIGGSGDGVVRRKLAKRSDTPRKDASIRSALQDLSLDQAPAEDAETVNPDSIATPPIAVKQDTLNLMAKMFPAGTDGTKGVRWTQFQQGLTDAGMSATQGAGSAVVFSNRHGGGSISFHMPHPEPVVTAYTLRGFSKRLHKWFGWTNETFVLRQKEGAEVLKGVAK